MDQILQLEPKQELRFRGPFNEVVTACLRLTNPSDKRVCFKVKTTAPKRYCVRPNCGVVEPHQTMPVQVMLQPFEYDPQERNKHKFMVQSMYAPEGVLNHEVLWRDAPKEQIMDSKLRCFFQMPGHEEDGVGQPGHDAGHDVFSPSVQEHPEPSQQIATESGDFNTRETLKKLQSEILHLRKENSSLREDGLRYRAKAQVSSETIRSVAPVATAHSGAPESVSHNVLLIYAVMLLIAGVVLGKCVF